MFGLFKRKLPFQPTVTLDDKKWVEESMDWLIKAFSLSKIKDQPFLLTKEEIITGSTTINKHFDSVLDACYQLLAKNDKSAMTYNNIGYALSGKKEYRPAMVAFTRSIELEPFWDYTYNNRGYCRLQLGEVEEAFPDLHSSWEMNPDNSFNWRNLGIYYWLNKENDKALEYLEKAEKLDPNTEMINFYLSLVHQASGNTEKAIQYLEKSKALAEYNDSIFQP